MLTVFAGPFAAVPGMKVRVGFWFSLLVHCTVRTNEQQLKQKKNKQQQKRKNRVFLICVEIRLSLKVSVLVALLNEVYKMIFVCLVMWYILLGRPIKKELR